MARATKTPRKKAEKTLTQELAALLEKELLPDLVDRARQPTVAESLRHRWEAERQARRTADELGDWVSHTVEQVGAAWILSCVFVRVLEDRGLLERRRLAGEGASDSLQQFFEIAPALTERDYLLTVFRELAGYPGAADVLGPTHNPAWRLSPSNDKVRRLLELLNETGPDGQLRFRFEGRDTRFLGDLYQDLSEGVRKRYALLQTPKFIERFILDQTLEPAIKEFGLAEVRLIDPTCGSGHFLLGAFDRLFEHRQRTWPDRDAREHATAALSQVYGVDVNPYAVAIARFRLTLAYLAKAGIERLAQAPRIETHVVVADSLLHGGKGQGRLSEQVADKAAWGDQMFALDDDEGARLMFAQRYHAVVGNPPYITCKDPVLRDEYRAQFRDSACGKYALGAPFTERLLQLAAEGGFVGLINANSFMKREFGKGLIEKVFPRVDLTQVIDTSGAYIPGHGTPTVLLFARNRPPVGDTVRAVMGKRGEPSTPDDAEQGLVWSSIQRHHDEALFENDFLSVAEIPRATLGKHPWSLGGGGASDLKELLEERSQKRLGDLVTSIGFMAIVGEDELYIAPVGTWSRWGLPAAILGVGESVRDWSLEPAVEILLPYDSEWNATESAAIYRTLWPYKRLLSERLMFGKTQIQAGLKWFEYRHLGREKLRPALSIAFAFVATHNHFVLDRGGKVFNRSAPIMKLPRAATEDDHLALLAYLNSSTACFWMKQVCMNKGGSGVGRGIQDEAWESRFEFDGTKLATIPIPAGVPAVVDIARRLDEMVPLISSRLREAKVPEAREIFREMVALQEELDWETYAAVGLLDAGELDRVRDAKLGPVDPGHRPFEVLLAAPDADRGTAWFERNGYAVPDPTHMTEAVRVRLEIIARHPELQLIERPEYKRRWTVPDWQGARQAHLRGLLLGRLETLVEYPRIETLRGLAARAEGDADCRSYLEELGFTSDTTNAIGQLITAEAVPFVAGLRFSDSGFARHRQWRAVWELQRREDRGEKVSIDVPEKYGKEDHASPVYWTLRGKLDVPKERFISYPGCERDEDRSPLVGWAGWDHLQRAQALAALFEERKRDGWDAERLEPILAGIVELVSWVKQWHNEPDADGYRMGDEFERLASEKARELGLTIEGLREWCPRKKDADRSVRAVRAKKARNAAPDTEETPTT